MLSAAFRPVTTCILLLKPKLLCHSFTVTRGRRLWMRPYLVSLYKRRLDQGPEPDRHRSVWLNWNYDAEIFAFGKRLGEEFNRKTLKQAFLMSSYIKKQQEERLKLGLTNDVAQVDLEDNGELFCIGENAATHYIGAFLQHCFPRLPSDGISAITDFLLKTETLANVAGNLGIKDLVQTEEFPVSSASLSTVFIAIVGALQRDQGKERAELFIRDFILTELIGKDIFEMWTVSNPMGLLVDTLRQQGLSDPEPRLLWSTGSETILASYVVGIYVDRKLIGQAPGETVSIAEQMAARDALRRLWQFEQSRSPLPFDGITEHSTSNRNRTKSS